MRSLPGLPFLLAFAAAAAAAEAQAPVRPGVDVLLDGKIGLVENRRVGLITNPSGVDRRLVPTADRLHRDPRVKLVQLYGPEHGIRGDVPAGDHVGDAKDPETGLPVQSLYGKIRRPTPESLARLDVLLFDIQDVGSRTYTYASTLGEAMIAAKEAKIPFVVLDRPNPLGGLLFEGPVQTDAHKSFIGWGPVPVTHGMTFGELARFYDAGLGIGCDLHVVTMTGWKRSMVWEDTGLRWVPTSPHIPHALQAHLYVATGMIGGVTTNVNEGVGSTLPFECVAAPWLDGPALAAALAKADLPGVTFRAIAYSPFYGKFQKTPLRGVQLVLDDPRKFRPLRTALAILSALESLHPGKAEFIEEAGFLRHWTDPELIALLRKGAKPADLEARWADGLRRFAERRQAALLY